MSSRDSDDLHQSDDDEDDGVQSPCFWSCSQCTFENKFRGFALELKDAHLYCEMCSAGTDLSNVVAQVHSRTGLRLCVRCTLLNPAGLQPSTCLACDATLLPAQSTDPELADLMQQLSLPTPDQAANYRSLRSEPEFADCQPYDLAEAVRSCGDRPDYFDFVADYFNNECPLCFEKLPRHRLLQMSSCQCKLCYRCFYNFVTTNLDNNDHVTHLQCPICNTPNSEDIEGLQFHFEFLMNQVTTFSHPGVKFDAEKVGLLSKRLCDWNLMREPNFRWCSHCPNGMLLPANMLGLRFQCEHCSKATCKDCQKPWQDQHKGIGCEQFQHWLMQNDPEYQERGIAAYLQCNGIQCPKCKFKYALARGGCLHFTCRQCRAEFCSGCGGFFERVEQRGLLCKHPRDCLFYLRDFDVASLQRLLKCHKVEFETVKINSSSSRSSLSSVDNGQTCGVMEQKETNNGRLVDEACGKETGNGQAGLCKKHYIEYLVSLVNKHKLDPVEVMDCSQLRELCRRHSVQFKRAISDDSAALRQLVVKQVPLTAAVSMG